MQFQLCFVVASLIALSTQPAAGQEFQVIGSTPSPADSSVAVEAVVEFTFSAPVDTSARFESGSPLSFYSISPREAISIDSPSWSDDLTQVRFDVVHNDTTEYVWILANARSQDDANLCPPYVLSYTTRPNPGTAVVTGYAGQVIAVKRGQCRTGFVALLDAPPDSSAEIAAAAAIDHNGEFEMRGVRPGTYWPVFLFDWDRDGEIRPEWSRIGDVTAEVGLKDDDHDGNPDSLVVSDSSSIEIFVGASGGSVEGGELPGTARLLQNFPNPFRQSTNLAFELERPLRLTVSIYDLLGRRIATAASGYYATGRHEVRWSPSPVAAGVYIVRLSGPDFALTRPILQLGD